MSTSLPERLRGLREERRRTKAKHAGESRRKPLTAEQRSRVLKKTAGRCHICGGEITGRWQADHVLAFSGGGSNDADNFLPAHALCNNYRWDYSSEEFQMVMKLGVWIRKQIEDKTPLGREVTEKFLKYEARREKRRSQYTLIGSGISTDKRPRESSSVSGSVNT